MAFHFVDAPISSLVLGTDDEVMVTPAGRVMNGTGDAISQPGFARDARLTLNGDVQARDTAIVLDGTSLGNQNAEGINGGTISIGAGVSVSAATAQAIRTYGSDVSLVNHGTVMATRNAVEFRGNDYFVQNTGTISSVLETGLDFAPADVDVTRMIRVENSGTIAGRTAIDNAGAGATLKVVNTGKSWRAAPMASPISPESPGFR